MQIIRKLVEVWPGKRFGVYRFLPLFFVLGAGLEFTMINWWVDSKRSISAHCKIFLGELVKQTSTTHLRDDRLRT